MNRSILELPAPLREILVRFGWLEIMVSPDLWPDTMFADGVRFFGLGQGVPDDLSLAAQVGAYRALMERTRRKAEEYEREPAFSFGRFDSMTRRVPVFSTLEGVCHSWCTNGRELAWFNDFAIRWEEILDGEILRNDSPLFGKKSVDAVVALLLERLEYRVERAKLLRRARDALATLGEVIDDRGNRKRWVALR